MLCPNFKIFSPKGPQKRRHISAHWRNFQIHAISVLCLDWRIWEHPYTWLVGSSIVFKKRPLVRMRCSALDVFLSVQDFKNNEHFSLPLPTDPLPTEVATNSRGGSVRLNCRDENTSDAQPGGVTLVRSSAHICVCVTAVFTLNPLSI